MNDPAWKGFLLCSALIAALLLSGCAVFAGDRKSETLPSTDGSFLERIASADARVVIESEPESHSFIIRAKNTFYNTLPELPTDLPEMELEDALKKEGLSDSSEHGYITESIAGGYNYSLDLSALAPIARAPDGAIICRLTDDTQPSALFVLDAQSPQRVQYYFSRNWDGKDEEHTFLLDGKQPSPEEETLCERLLQAHFSPGEPFILLDGDPSVHTVTVRFVKLPGFAYQFNYQQYSYEGGCISLFSRVEEQMVRVD